MSTELNVSARPPRIAIVGSGPSGCYMAQSLRKAWRDAEIVIYDRLDEPYGLLRYGVAPDHLGTKGITKQFDRLFSRDGVAFVGRGAPSVFGAAGSSRARDTDSLCKRKRKWRSRRPCD